MQLPYAIDSQTHQMADVLNALLDEAHVKTFESYVLDGRVLR